MLLGVGYVPPKTKGQLKPKVVDTAASPVCLQKAKRAHTYLSVPDHDERREQPEKQRIHHGHVHLRRVRNGITSTAAVRRNRRRRRPRHNGGRRGLRLRGGRQRIGRRRLVPIVIVLTLSVGIVVSPGLLSTVNPAPPPVFISSTSSIVQVRLISATIFIHVSGPISSSAAALLAAAAAPARPGRRRRVYSTRGEHHHPGREARVLDHRGEEKPARLPERVPAAGTVGVVSGWWWCARCLAGQGRVSEVGV